VLLQKLSFAPSSWISGSPLRLYYNSPTFNSSQILAFVITLFANHLYNTTLHQDIFLPPLFGLFTGNRLGTMSSQRLTKLPLVRRSRTYDESDSSSSSSDSENSVDEVIWTDGATNLRDNPHSRHQYGGRRQAAPSSSWSQTRNANYNQRDLMNAYIRQQEELNPSRRYFKAHGPRYNSRSMYDEGDQSSFRRGSYRQEDDDEAYISYEYSPHKIRYITREPTRVIMEKLQKCDIYVDEMGTPVVEKRYSSSSTTSSYASAAYPSRLVSHDGRMDDSYFSQPTQRRRIRQGSSLSSRAIEEECGRSRLDRWQAAQGQRGTIRGRTDRYSG
jgi:hypothetical protein